MNHLFLLPALLLLCISASAQQWNWIQKIDGNRCENVMDMAFTPEEDVMVTGIYEDQGGVRFQSSDGNAVERLADQDTFPYSHSTLFLCKYSKTGVLKWNAYAYAENGITPVDMTTDTKGNSIVVGSFRGMAIFHSTDGSTKTIRGMRGATKRDSPPLNYYVAKFDPDGVLLWARVAYSQNHAGAREVATDEANNVYVSAYAHYGSISFDTHVLLPTVGHGRSIYNLRLILVKYTPTGEEEWIVWGGDLTVKKMMVTPEGNITVRGYHATEAKIANTNGQVYTPAKWSGDEKICSMLFHFNNAGELVLVEPEFPTVQGVVHKTVTNASGDTYALMSAFPTESTSGSIPGRPFNFYWMNDTLKTQWYDIFVAKFDAQNRPLWVMQMGGKNDDRPLNIELDRNGNVLVTGSYWNQVTLTGTTGETLELETVYEGVFLASLTPNGQLQWAQNCGGHYQGFTKCTPMLISKNNELLMGGSFNVPSQIGGQNFSFTTEAGLVINAKNDKYNYCRYSDGFIGHIDLEQQAHAGTVFVAVSLQRKMPELLALMLAKIKSLPVATYPKELAIHSETIFTSSKPKPSDENTLEPTAPLSEPVLQALVYPNPSNSQTPQIMAELNLNQPEKITWTLISTTGIVMKKETISYDAGLVQYPFSLTDATPGIYLLIIEAQQERLVKRMVVN